MRLTFEFGPLNLDFSLTLGAQAAEFEAYQDAGSTSSTIISGEHNGWEKHPNGCDEPGEGDEGLRVRKPGFWMGPLPS